MATEPIAGTISVRGLRKAYGPSLVLRDVTLTIESAERVALLGANGAGKTTLLKVLATLLRPSAGHVIVGGFDAVREANEVRRLIGFAGHQTYLYDQLTAEENLTFYGRLYRLPHLPERVAAALEGVGLYARRNVTTGQLSHGQRQRLSLARATLHDPAVLVLDEPDTGLDSAGLDILAGIIGAAGRTVLFTTHNSERASELAQRSVVLTGGRIDPGDGQERPDQPVERLRVVR